MLPSEQEVSLWWDRFPLAGIGIVTGKVSGIVVVDFDSDDAIKYAEDNGLLDTVLVKTGRGYHAYFLYPNNITIKNSVKLMGMKIDIRADGGYVVAPPTEHPNGHIYQWVKGKGLNERPLQKLPEIFYKQRCSNNNGNPNIRPQLRELYRVVNEGKRNSSLARIVGSLCSDGLSLQECLKTAIAINTHNKPPMSDDEVQRTVKSVYKTHNRQKQKEGLIFIERNVFKMPLFVYNRDLIHKKIPISVSNHKQKCITIEPSDGGLPGWFDETVFFAICKVISKMPKPIQNPINIGSISSIASTMGISFSGNISQDIKDSIKRISQTHVYLKKAFYDKSQQSHIDCQFRVFDRVEFSEGKRNEQNLVWLNPLILDSINSSNLIPFNYATYTALSGFARGLYKVISPLLNIQKTRLKIPYSTIQQKLQCKRETTPSRIKQQLDKALDDLVSNRVIKGYIFSNRNRSFYIIIEI